MNLVNLEDMGDRPTLLEQAARNRPQRSHWSGSRGQHPERACATPSLSNGAQKDGLGRLFICLPFLFLTAPHGEALWHWLSATLLWHVGLATVFELLLGFVPGKLCQAAESRGMIQPDWRFVYTVALGPRVSSTPAATLRCDAPASRTRKRTISAPGELRQVLLSGRWLERRESLARSPKQSQHVARGVLEVGQCSAPRHFLRGRDEAHAFGQ